MRKILKLIPLLGLLVLPACRTVHCTPEEVAPIGSPVLFVRAPVQARTAGLSEEELGVFHKALILSLADASGIRVVGEPKKATHQLGVLVEELEDGEGIIRFILGFGVGRVHVAIRAVLWDRKAREVARTSIAKTKPLTTRLPSSTRLDLLADGAREVSGFVKRLMESEGQEEKEKDSPSKGKVGPA